MARSVLLQLARDSIQEVLEAQRSIDKQALFQEHPLLHEKIATKVNIYIDEELKGSSESLVASASLLEDIVFNAKKAAFEDKNFSPITTSQYINCEIELELKTKDGTIRQKDVSIISTSSFSLSE